MNEQVDYHKSEYLMKSERAHESFANHEKERKDREK